MKIRHLHINRFGHFNECDLPFTGDGIQVIYGPNEAGKTTLLECLRGILFDFPSRTPYDFGGQGELAGVATLELQDGRTVELRRRKGNKNKVAIKIDGLATDLDDNDWLRLLDHADRNLFESVFAFGLGQLSQGEASLKHESVQSALFSGGLGGNSSPDKAMAALTAQAEALFKKGGSKPVVNALLAEIKRLTALVKEHTLRPDKYLEARDAYDRCREQAQATHRRVEELRTQYSQVEKLERACPLWWKLQQRRSEREPLDIPQAIPVDARQRYAAIHAELETLRQDQLQRHATVQQLEKQLQAITRAPDVLQHRAEIKSCLELRQSFIEAQEQLPQRERNRTELQRQIDRELTHLRPGWTHADLQAFMVDMATREQIDRLSEEQRNRHTRRTTLQAKHDSDAEELKRAQVEFAGIGELPDITALVALLGEESEMIANRKALDSLQPQLKKLDRKIDVQRRKLSPPLAVSAMNPEQLSVPRPETVADFESRMIELRKRIQREAASLEDDTTQHAETAQTLNLATSSGHVPSLDERDTARVRRETGWNLIRQKYLSGSEDEQAVSTWLDEAGERSLPDAYEHAVRQADQIADHLFENANEVARREELNRQLNGLNQRITQKQQRLAGLESEQLQLQTHWEALWQASGFTPLAPDAMRSWLQDHESISDLISQREDLQQEQESRETRICEFVRRLSTATGREDDQMPQLLAAARQTVDDVKSQRQQTTELEKKIKRLHNQLKAYEADLASLASDEETAKKLWQELLQQLHLPVEWKHELARQVIDKLDATHVRLESLPEEEIRISAMRSRIREFDQRVRSICELIDVDLLNIPREVAIKKLDGLVEQAVHAEREHGELTRALLSESTQCALLHDREQTKNSERLSLLALAGVETEAEFLEIVSRVEQAAQLDVDIAQLLRELDLIRAGERREAFEEVLAQSEQPVLQGQASDLKAQLEAAEALRKAADGEEAVARDVLQRLDGSAQAAIHLEHLTQCRARLAAEVDRYMPVIYARSLLKSAVQRFEKENQPELIATVSQLFRQMTGERYVEFDRTGGGKQNILVRRADGVERVPDELSSGTREQLYLAIRLAYVLHYCRRNQPLPLIIDDVLANFDDQRVRQTFATLADISRSVQVMFFTCHPHMLQIAREVIPDLQPVEIGGSGQNRVGKLS